ncbi:hypothetical protein BDQ17DRAFT_1433053 [Cyathus striatus]|nr:hypothetical protein BDQ17DRAFT_1433053 [Cyathus striatus]
MSVEHASTMLMHFYGAITASPSLTLYIRELSIVNQNYRSNHYFLDKSTFPDVLGMLQSITTFELNFNYRCNWLDLTQSCRQALFTMISSPRIESLYLKGVYNIPRVISKCITAIPTAHIVRSKFVRKAESDELVMYEPPPNIDNRGGLNCFKFASLFKDVSQPLIDALSSPKCKLEKLVVSEFDHDYYHSCNTHFNYGDFEMARVVIRIHKDSLTDVEFLDIYMLRDVMVLSELINNLPHLRNLKFTVFFNDFEPVLFREAIQILSAIPKENEIRKIQLAVLNLHRLAGSLPGMILVDKSDGGPEEQELYKEYLSEWECLDALFTEFRFARLEKKYRKTSW